VNTADKERVLARIEQGSVRPGRQTDVCAGVLAAVRQMAEMANSRSSLSLSRSRDGVADGGRDGDSRQGAVLLISDGRPNVGVTDTRLILSSVQRNVEQHVGDCKFLTFGVGAGE
jgi:hypothetical protein